VKRKFPICVRDRADDGEAGVLVEEVVADNEGGAAAFYVKIGVIFMPSITLRAHFNGNQVVLDEPFSLERDAKLLVTVLSTDKDEEREDWLGLSAQGLESAYGDDEPEYSLERLISVNPEYDRR
jgi:hypothetical protein